ILAAGQTHTISGTSFLAARVHGGGSPDPAWGGPGIGLQRSGAIQLHLPDPSKEGAAYAIRLQSSGNAGLAGFGPSDRHRARLPPVLPDGPPDPGPAGTKLLALPGDAAALAMTLDSHDRMIVAGYHDTHTLVARLTPDGSLDPSFAQGGYVDLDPVPGVAS